MRFILIIFASLGCTAALAVDIVDARVDKQGPRYHVFGSSLIQASPEFIYQVLMDFDNFHKLAGGIKETHFVPGEHPGEVLGYTLIESCVLFFCRRAEKLERIEATPYSEIRAVVIPAQSDFVMKVSRWILEPQGDATLLSYEAEFEPDFWLPPLIGTWAIKRKLVESAQTIGMRIEFMAAKGLTLAEVRKAEGE